MLRPLKKIVPLAARTKLKWLGYAAQDIVGGAHEARVPQRRDTFIGGGDFITVGEDFFTTLKRYGLTPDMDVLDVGCGQGRMARPLIGFFDTGHYTGFDIVGSGIECLSLISSTQMFLISATIKQGRLSPKITVFPLMTIVLTECF